jgi:hypothetical protein
MADSFCPVARKAPTRYSIRDATLFAGLLIAVLVLFQLPAFAQVGTSSLGGTVYDSSGAVVPNAEVVLKNEATGVTRSVTSNSVGFFNFVSLVPGTYTVTISMQGFASWEQRDIVLNAYESRTLPNIALKVGAAATTVEVVASAEALAPVNTGESRMTLNQNMVSQLMIQGRNAAELIKILPGMAIIGASSMLDQTQYSSLTTQTNNGVVGRYAASGTQPYGGLQLTIDGGVIVDTGNMGTQVANINQDQTAELTVRNSSFDAEYAHGPVTVNAASRSGGSAFHGELYTYARGATFNSEDSYLKNQNVSKPNDHYWYPGFTIGGPVLFPHSDFNKNRDKLFFFGGFEYMLQHPVGSLYNLVVPTAAMRNGDFSAASLAPFQGHGWPSADIPCDPANSGQWWWGNFCGGAGITGGDVSSYIDPNGLAYMNTFPEPNADPADTGGYNYRYLDQSPVNRWEMKVRGDYNVTENTRLYVSYNRQAEKDLNVFGVWWWPNGTLPYPSNFPAQQLSYLWSASVTHVFSPSLTNETTFNYTSFINPLKFANPAAVEPTSVGMNIQLPFDTGTAPMIPNTLSWAAGGSVPMYFAPAFSGAWQNGAFGALKRVPSLADNLAWVKGSHTMKFGFYWARWGNQQTEGTWDSNSGFPQGRYEFDNWAWGTTGNPIADMLIGHPVNFAQTSADPVHTAWYTEMAFYAQDQWKASRRLTLNFGLRFDHEGQWFPVDEPGLLVWDPSTCTSTGTGPGCQGAELPGFTWNARNSSIPISGFKSASLVPDPRVGVAYDLFGNGKTVIRGGFGMYRYQLAYNSTISGVADGPMGIQAFQTTCNLLSWDQISDPACLPATPAGTLPAASGSIAMTALQKDDDRTPYTQNWNVMIDLRGPWNSLFEIGYAGSRSRNLLLGGNGGNNVDRIPLGAFFQPDPVTGDLYCQPPFVTTGCTGSGIPGDATVNFKPYYYSKIQVNTHGSYANYNALQMSWQKQTGRATFMFNYTWSKTMGIRDGQTDNGTGANGTIINPFNLESNYGVLGYDRTHIFNAAYVIRLPDAIKGDTVGEKIGKGFLNGWQISGITQIQSGAPIQPSTNGTLNAVYPGGWSTNAILGTDSDSGAKLVPVLTCDPRKGLSSGQYFNPACFAPPTTQGQFGNIIWPYIKGPRYFDSDLGIYKNFKITERQSLQFRVQAFNFLNHPLPDFTLRGEDLQLSFDCGSSSLCTPSALDPTLSMTNVNTSTTGKPLYTRGRRVLEFALKYTF